MGPPPPLLPVAMAPQAERGTLPTPPCTAEEVLASGWRLAHHTRHPHLARPPPRAAPGGLRTFRVLPLGGVVAAATTGRGARRKLVAAGLMVGSMGLSLLRAVFTEATPCCSPWWRGSFLQASAMRHQEERRNRSHPRMHPHDACTHHIRRECRYTPLMASEGSCLKRPEGRRRHLRVPGRGSGTSTVQDRCQTTVPEGNVLYPSSL